MKHKIINYFNLFQFLNTIPNNNIYTGGKLETLYWLDINSGINRKNQIKHKLFGLKYIQGIGIIFSFDVILKILSNVNKINYSIVDDVTIGLFVRDNIKYKLKYLELKNII